MKRFRYILLIMTVLTSLSCTDKGREGRGYVYSFGNPNVLAGLENGLYHDGEKIVDIKKVFLETKDSSIGTITDVLSYTIDGTPNWGVIYDERLDESNVDFVDPDLNLAAAIVLMQEMYPQDRQLFRVFAQKVNGKRYSGARFNTVGTFMFPDTSAGLETESVNVKCFYFYENPDNYRDVDLSTYVAIKLKTGNLIEIIYKGNASVL